MINKNLLNPRDIIIIAVMVLVAHMALKPAMKLFNKTAATGD